MSTPPFHPNHEPLEVDPSIVAALTEFDEQLRSGAVDIVVVPSWDEGFSLVTIEALAARRAVLASNVGGIAGIIQDGVTGLLFPPRDVQAITDKLLFLVADAPLRDRLGAHGQRDVYTRYGREQIINRIESLYLTVLC